MLTEEIKNHLNMLPPHVRERRTAILLIRAADEIKQLDAKLDEGKALIDRGTSLLQKAVYYLEHVDKSCQCRELAQDGELCFRHSLLRELDL